jgi:single-stranded DNA-binding protein
MLNQVVLVGRIKELDGDTMIIAIPRSYKNEDGEYDTDYIRIEMNSDNLRDNINAHCSIGDLVGVKGALRTSDMMYVIAEKVTFLSSKKQ